MIPDDLNLMAHGATIALLLLPVGILLAWRATAALAAGPPLNRAAVVCCAGMVPPLLVGVIWASNALTYGRAHELMAGCILTTAIGAAAAGLLICLWPRPD
jgi:hypothetical protein